MNYWPGRIIVILLLLLGTLPSRAQYGEDTVTSVIQDTVTAGDYTQTDDPEKTKFLKKEEYTGIPLAVQERTVPDSVVKKAQEDKNFWYANAVIEKEKPEAYSSYVPVTLRPWFQTLVWFIIIGGFATFLMIYLSNNNIGLFRKKKVLTTAGEEGEEITEDIFAINYQREIDKAAAAGNYRLAVRLMFLRLLKNMAEKNIIRYQQDKTNFDYLMQLHGTSYYPHFFRITRNYEYSWYGKFDISEENYGLIRKDVDHFETGLR
ncbi:MAG: hypothetical protein ABIT05_10470 [Chitinophagaceae bacterium]